MDKTKKVKGIHNFKWKRCPFCGQKNALYMRRCKECSFWFIKHCKECGQPNTWEVRQCVACNETFYQYCRQDGSRIIEEGGMGICEEHQHSIYKICDVCHNRYPVIMEKCPFCAIKAHKSKPKMGGGS